MTQRQWHLHLVEAAARYFEMLSASSFLPHRIALVWLVLSLLVPSYSVAKIYKVVDEHGNVTFSDEPPREEGAEVVPMPTATNRYDGESIRARQRDLVKAMDEQRELTNSTEKRYQQEKTTLETAVEQAETQLAEAKTVKNGDYIALAKGGTRLSPAYHDRVAKAQQRLEAAQAALAALRIN